MQPAMQPAPGYALGHSRTELERLTAQARMLEPASREMFQAAGLSGARRVLDVGSGAGDVAFLAASIAGPEAEVVGVDRAPQAVEAATARARGLGLDHVRFLTGDPVEFAFDEPFDAIIGRLVLLYYPDPAAALRKLARLLRPGGLLAFQDFDMAVARSYPAAPLFERSLDWIRTAFTRAGVEIQMGLRLYSEFVDAGLPAPELRLSAAIGGGRGNIAYFVVAEVVRSLLPLIERYGVASAAEVDVDSLRDRLEAEVVRGGGVVIAPSLVGAWARLE